MNEAELNALVKEMRDDYQIPPYHPDSELKNYAKEGEMHLGKLNSGCSITEDQILSIDLNYTKLYKHILAPILDKFNVDIEDRNYIVKFYIKGIMAIVQLWIKSNFKESIDHICNLIIQLIPRSKI